VRREDGLELGLDGLHPAAATVEIVAIADDGGDTGPVESEVAEGERGIVEAETLWPAEISTEFVVQAAGIEIETASLPALAGEPAAAAASSHNGWSTAESEESLGVPRIIGEAARDHGPGDEGTPVDGVDQFPAAPHGSEGEPSTPFAAEREGPAHPPTLEPRDMPPPPTQPAHVVQTVTDKPANPRKGWWQRLIQS
jgi:hypothetical protein